MTTERDESGLLKSWLDETYEAERDAQPFLDRVLDDVPNTPQRGRRWWSLPTLRRSSTPLTAVQTTDYQPTSTPALNGHTPTVTGRTQSMFSPVKAITAGALVFAIGGAFLIAQPFDQQGGGVPGAETNAEPLEPVEFTATFSPSVKIREGTFEAVPGVSKQRGRAFAPVISGISDARLDGAMTYSENTDQYRGHVFGTVTYRIVNTDGAWQGSTHFLNGGVGFPSVVVLVGEEAYEGLYAWMDASDWDAVRGVIFPAPPPAAPVPPTAE